MARPVWFDYCVWDYTDPSFPVLVGLREDTPEDIRKKFERDQRAFARAREEGIDL